MRRLITGLVVTSLLIVAGAAPAFAAKPMTGLLWLDGEQVRTIVPPAAMTQEGRDNLYVFPGEEQGPVAATGPGDIDYHGGKWAVWTVTVNEETGTLKSEEDVLAAVDYGLVSITRVPEADFKCPIQGH
jgi:hypothetical protein